MKRFSKVFAILLAIAMVLPGISGITEATPRKPELRTVIDLNLRSTDNDRAAPVVYVERGETVIDLREVTSNGYFKLRYKGKEGYAHRSDVTSHYGTGKFTHVDLKEKSNGKTYKVVKDDVLKSKDLKNSLPTAILERGDEVTHKGTTGKNYFLVENKYGGKGYIYRGDVTSPHNFDNGEDFVSIKTKKEAVSKNLKVIRNDVLRAKDRADAGTTAILKRGDIVTYEGTTDNNWFLLKTKDGKRGYIYRGYVTKSEVSETPDSEDNDYNEEEAIELKITSYNKHKLSIEIPKFIKGSQIKDKTYKGFELDKNIKNDEVGVVNAIGQEAFINKKLRNVVIPDSVTTIEDYAFSDNKLRDVIIPDGVTMIESGAFLDNELRDVVIPNSVTVIEGNAFTRNNLTSIKLPDNLTHIGFNAFAGNNLTSIKLPDNLTHIGSNAFGWNQLSSVTIPDSVTSIGNSAFENNKLRDVVISDNITKIESYIFRDNQLTNVDIPDNVRYIYYRAFSGNNLTSIKLSENLVLIHNYAFEDNNLTSVFIPDSVTKIGGRAFISNKLTKITLPDNVEIGNDLLANYNNQFRNVYLKEGGGIYTGTQEGDWIKQ